MTITAEDYIHYQAQKHTNKQTDPVDAILDHIKNNPQSYLNKVTHNNNNDSQNIHDEQVKKQTRKWAGIQTRNFK